MSTMSPPSLTTDHGTELQDAAVSVGRRLQTPLRAGAFWAAIVLPFLYLPLLVGGLAGSELVAFFGLMAANAVALLVGHDYGR